MARDNVKTVLRDHKAKLVTRRKEIGDQIDNFQLQVTQLQTQKADLNTEIAAIDATIAELDALP